MSADGEQQTNHQHRNKPPRRNWRATNWKFFDLRLSHWSQTILSAALVGLAFAQWVIYNRQAQIMDRQAEIGASQLRLSQNTERAVLIVDGIDLEQKRFEPDITPQGLDLVISIRNAGRSTAPIQDIKVIPIFHLQKGALPNVPNYFAPSTQTVITPIIQNDIAYAYIQMRDITSSPGFSGRTPDRSTLIQGLRSGEIPFEIYGFVKYSAGIGWDWNGVTGYCYRYVPVSRRTVRQFEPCDNQNYSYAY